MARMSASAQRPPFQGSQPARAWTRLAPSPPLSCRLRCLPRRAAMPAQSAQPHSQGRRGGLPGRNRVFLVATSHPASPLTPPRPVPPRSRSALSQHDAPVPSLTVSGVESHDAAREGRGTAASAEEEEEVSVPYGKKGRWADADTLGHLISKVEAEAKRCAAAPSPAHHA